jgi:hypothetical protein
MNRPNLESTCPHCGCGSYYQFTVETQNVQCVNCGTIYTPHIKAITLTTLDALEAAYEFLGSDIAAFEKLRTAMFEIGYTEI